MGPAQGRTVAETEQSSARAQDPVYETTTVGGFIARPGSVPEPFSLTSELLFA